MMKYNQKKAHPVFNTCIENIISPTNLSFVKEAIAYIKDAINFTDYKQALWLVFGSYVINMNMAGSDLDIIAIDNSFTENKRLVYYFKGVPIHFTGINMKAIVDDGEDKLYGGYFSGKTINPHIFLYGNDDFKNEALYHAGKFIGSLAGYLSGLTRLKFFTPSNITSLVFIAYLSTDPSFDSYFLNYFVSPNFNNIWIALCKSTVHMLKTSGVITMLGGKYVFNEKHPDYKTFHSERMKISARHWSYGAVCHGGDHKFQDTIFDRAENKMKKIDPTGKKYSDMVRFLKGESGLPEIYI